MLRRSGEPEDAHTAEATRAGRAEGFDSDDKLRHGTGTTATGKTVIFLVVSFSRIYDVDMCKMYPSVYRLYILVVMAHQLYNCIYRSTCVTVSHNYIRDYSDVHTIAVNTLNIDILLYGHESWIY